MQALHYRANSKKGAIEGKDKAISVGKKIYEKSGAKSFIDGLLE